MTKHLSIQSTVPAPVNRPDFATWFAAIKKMAYISPVFRRHLNDMHMLRLNGIDAKLMQTTNKQCEIRITGLAVS